MVQKDVQSQEDHLVKNGVMLDGEAMEALGYIPKGQSDPNQIYFVPPSPELQSSMTKLGMGDMKKDVLHTVPLHNKGRTLGGVEFEAGVRVSPLTSDIHTYGAQKTLPNGNVVKGQVRVKYAAVPIAGNNLPVHPTTGLEARVSNKEGEVRGKAVATASGQVSSIVTVRTGLTIPSASGGNRETSIYVEGEAGFAADGKVSIGLDTGNLNESQPKAVPAKMERPLWQGGGVRILSDYVFQPSQQLPPWMNFVAQQSGMELPTVAASAELRIFGYREHDGSGTLKIEIAYGAHFSKDVADIPTARARGVHPLAVRYLRRAFGYAGASIGYAWGRALGGGPGGGVAAESFGAFLAAGGTMFANGLFDSVYQTGDGGGRIEQRGAVDIDGDQELEQVVVVREGSTDQGPVDVDSDGDTDVFYTMESNSDGGVDVNNDGNADVVVQPVQHGGTGTAEPQLTHQVFTPMYVKDGDDIMLVGTQITQVFSDGSQRSVVQVNQRGVNAAKTTGQTQLVGLDGQPMEVADADNPLGVNGGGSSTASTSSNPLDLNDLAASNGQPIAVVDGDPQGAQTSEITPSTPRVTSGVHSSPENSVVVELPPPSATGSQDPQAITDGEEGQAQAGANGGWEVKPERQQWMVGLTSAWVTFKWGGKDKNGKPSKKPDSLASNPQ
jgi:hypothetical protein